MSLSAVSYSSKSFFSPGGAVRGLRFLLCWLLLLLLVFPGLQTHSKQAGPSDVPVFSGAVALLCDSARGGGGSWGCAALCCPQDPSVPRDSAAVRFQ